MKFKERMKQAKQALKFVEWYISILKRRRISPDVSIKTLDNAANEIGGWIEYDNEGNPRKKRGGAAGERSEGR